LLILKSAKINSVNNDKEVAIMEEVSTKTQMVKIRNFEKGFMATHLINIGNKVGVFEKLNEKKEEGLQKPTVPIRHSRPIL
jgi:hypothetical protein